MPQRNLRFIAYAGVGIGTVAILLSVAALVLPVGKTNWGDAATWVQAITTIITAVFAIVAAKIARNLYLVETLRDQQYAEERRERVNEQRSAQAAKFCAWFGWRQDPNATFGNKDIMQYGAFVRNASDLPMYDVKAYFIDPRAVSNPDLRMPFYVEPVPVVPPDLEPTFFALERQLVEANFADVEDRQHIQVSIEFRDAANVRWRRSVTGHLMRPAADLANDGL